MRLPPYATLIRTFYTLSSLAKVQATIPTRQTLRQNWGYSGYLAAMPFSSLFGGSSSSSNNKMTYPDERTPDEWRAVLNKGKPLSNRPIHILKGHF